MVVKGGFTAVVYVFVPNFGVVVVASDDVVVEVVVVVLVVLVVVAAVVVLQVWGGGAGVVGARLGVEEWERERVLGFLFFLI